MDRNFINKRIKEQVDYIFDISTSVSLSQSRRTEILDSATVQYHYFTNKLNQLNTKNMNASLQAVSQFHHLFEHPVGTYEDVEPLKTRQLRVKLLFEELKELAVAGDLMGTFTDLCSKSLNEADNQKFKDGDNVDKIEELDALADLQYVLNGKVLTAGLHGIFDDAFDLVHSNNMTKAHRDEAHCDETIAASKISYAEGEWKKLEKSEGIWMLYNPDAKLTKPHDHIKVGLSGLVNDWIKTSLLKTEGKNTVELVRDEIVVLLSKYKLKLGIQTNKNQSFGKFANREAFDDASVSAIIIHPDVKHGIQKSNVHPVSVFSYSLFM